MTAIVRLCMRKNNNKDTRRHLNSSFGLHVRSAVHHTPPEALRFCESQTVWFPPSLRPGSVSDRSAWLSVFVQTWRPPSLQLMKKKQKTPKAKNLQRPSVPKHFRKNSYFRLQISSNQITRVWKRRGHGALREDILFIIFVSVVNNSYSRKNDWQDPFLVMDMFYELMSVLTVYIHFFCHIEET